MSELAARRKDTDHRTESLRSHLGSAEALIRGSACVYSTGSFGRREAGSDSDLDLFIVSKLKDESAKKPESRLRQLDEICLKADLIKATRELGIKDFDGDGQYLSHYTIKDIKDKLGKPEDDALNTFTARLLLLLESKPLIGVDVYREIIDDVIAAYWRDYEDHKDEFIPAFLVNDILRLWRTLCVNYEARTEKEPEEKNIKRRKKNYTLKHSRLLTCYSGIMFLLAKYRLFGSVAPSDVREMVSLSPTERLEWMLSIPDLSDAHVSIESIIRGYIEFLVEKSDADRFHDMFSTGEFRVSMAKSYLFAESVFDAVEKVGAKSRLYKLVVV
ncbi:nucleotidyltransferase domain-containing protein [Xanthobacter dioxanivorans]|uniref:Nucleotidyltransferase domain-containing protein n=1 Tax=Xanthobacter dioxanivorans TaxID=2528964 RepID=A0A974PQJ0_9HYPH|nr:nucleotidyltransferase domain-containing protein [Xanthobacter dioxanivorans]QRG07919.1 nucleotidyltransferase domain-containing protein [Xanthobacter dioxanivorans]